MFNWSLVASVSLAALCVFLLVLAWTWGKEGLKALVEIAKIKLGRENFEFIQDMATQLVYAAEQMGLREILLAEGADKKEWVIARLQAEADRFGIDIDMDLIESAIESAVKMMKELDS